MNLFKSCTFVGFLLILTSCSGVADMPELTLQASSEVISEGESSMLSWELGGGEPITLAIEPAPPQGTPLSSPFEVSPTETTTYTLTATNGVGSVSRSVEVVVNPLPVLVDFEVSAERIAQGRSVTVTWEVSGDDPVTATLTPSQTDEPVTSPLTLSPTETTTYTLTLTNSAGSISREFTVVVDEPTISSFSSTPSADNSLEQTFAWQLSSASTCSIDFGDGSEVIALEDCVTTTEIVHAYEEAGDYTVTFSLPTGAVQTLDVTVSDTDTPDTPPNTSPTVDVGEDMTVMLGDSVTLTGQVSDGDELTLSWEMTSQPEGSVSDLEGASTTDVTFTPDVAGQYTVTLTASDSRSVVSDNVSITVRAETDSDPVNTVYFLQEANITLTEGQTQVITLERTGTTVEPLTVFVQLAAATSATAEDYTITGATAQGSTEYEVVFEALRSRTEFALAAITDDIEETNEQVVFTLMPNDGYLQGQRTSLTIGLADEADAPTNPDDPDQPGDPDQPDNPDPTVNPRPVDERNCDNYFVATTQEQLDSLLGCEQISTLVIDPTAESTLSHIEGNSPITSLGALRFLEKAVFSLIISNVPTLTSLEGLSSLEQADHIRIDGNPRLTSLEGLHRLEWTFYVYIVGNPLLTSLTGLHRVETSFSLSVINNDSLVSLESLENLDLRGNLEPIQLNIRDNDSLTTLGSFDGLDYIGVLDVADNPALTSLGSFSHPTRFDILTLTNNNALTSLTGLENVTSIDELTIQDNARLGSLDGLEGLTGIRQDLVIVNNPELASLAAIANLTNQEVAFGNFTFNGSEVDITISDNAQLDCPAQNLAFAPDTSTGNAVNCVLRPALLPSIATFTATPDVINEEGQSSTLAWQVEGPEPITVNITKEGFNIINNAISIVEEAGAVGSVDVSPTFTTTYTLTASNSYGQTSDTLTITNNTPALLVCSGDYSVTTQTQLDALARCEQIEGSLSIGNGSLEIVSLQPLANVQRIQGSLRIGVIFRGLELTSLAGLDNLQVVEGDVHIVSNDNLTTLEGLNSLERVGGSLYIGEPPSLELPFSVGNTSLTSLEGLNNLSSVGGGVNILGNSALTSIEALSDLTDAQRVYIDNSAISTLESLGNVTNLQSFWLDNSPNVTNLEGLPDTSALTFLALRDNDALTSLQGLGNLSSLTNLWMSGNAFSSLAPLSNVSISGDLWITSSELTSLEGLEGTTSLTSLRLEDNSKLTSLQGLNNLVSVDSSSNQNWFFDGIHIGGDRYGGNNALMSLAALESLTHVDGDISITRNQALTSLVGLENITNYQNINSVEIIRNASLDCTPPPVLPFVVDRSTGNLVDCVNN